MADTAPPPATHTARTGVRRPDRTRSGALWVTATGAFLLFVAAALFVAVRWDTLGQPARLAILTGVTGAALVVGTTTRPSLPVTSRVLTHLGVLLIPVDVAAVAAHVLDGGGVPTPWAPLLAAAAGSAAVVWGLAGWRLRSTVLQALAVACVVPAAAGVAGTARIDAAPLVAAAAVAALVLDRRRPAVAWAFVAGLAPGLAAVLDTLDADRLAMGVGLGSGIGGVADAVAGLLAAVVVAVVARRDDEPGLLWPAAAAVVFSAGSARAGMTVDADADLLAVAVAFLVIELAALLGRTDPFWSRPLAGTATAVEAAGFVVGPLVAVAAFGSGLEGPVAAQAMAVGAVAWLVGDLRRAAPTRTLGPWLLLVGGGWAPAAPLAALHALAAVGAATDSGVVIGGAALMVAGVATVSGRPAGLGSAAVLAAVGPAVVGSQSAALAPVAGLVGAGVVAAGARLREATGRPDDLTRAGAATLAALVPGATAAAASWVDLGATASLAAMVVSWWLVATVLDRSGDTDADTDIATATRAGSPLALALLPRMATAVLVAVVALRSLPAVTDPLAAETLVVVAGVALALFGVDLVRAALADRTPDPQAGVASPLALTALVVGIGWEAGVTDGAIGIALALAAVVLTGVRQLVPDTWRGLVLGAASLAGAAGLAATIGAPGEQATVLLLVGGAVLVEAVVARSLPLAAVGVVAVIGGVWGHLAAASVTAADAWAAPVAVALLAAGVLAMGQGASSWVAFGPAVGLLGATAMAERLGGGGAGHALVAGGVGVAAVAVGGWRRWAAPLLLGTALLGALTAVESLQFTAGVPAWAWMAVGGTVLVAFGINLERHETGPVEAGQRVVDVVRTRYR